MQSRLLVNLILLTTVLALLGFIYFGNDNPEGQFELVSNLEPEQVDYISIQHNERLIELKKVNNKWSLTKPISIAANDFRIDSILKLLTIESHGHYELSTIEPSRYLLEKPVTSITFNDTRINFGDINPVSNYRYISVNEYMHLIEDRFYPLISSQVGALVSRTLVQPDEIITRLVLPDQTLELDSSDVWKSSKDISPDAIAETLNNWKHDQAFGVHSYMKRKSLGNLEAHLKNPERVIHFTISDTDPWLIIARPDIDIEYHFDTDMQKRLLEPGAEIDIGEEEQLGSQVVPPEKFMNTP